MTSIQIIKKLLMATAQGKIQWTTKRDDESRYYEETKINETTVIFRQDCQATRYSRQSLRIVDPRGGVHIIQAHESNHKLGKMLRFLEDELDSGFPDDLRDIANL